MKLQLFHRIGADGEDSAAVRAFLVHHGLNDKIEFRNVGSPENADAFRQLGGLVIPALVGENGRLVSGRDGVMAWLLKERPRLLGTLAKYLLTDLRYDPDNFGRQAFFAAITRGTSTEKLLIDETSGPIWDELIALMTAYGGPDFAIGVPLESEMEVANDSDFIPGPNYTARCNYGRLLNR